jgi:hypothetical protein
MWDCVLWSTIPHAPNVLEQTLIAYQTNRERLIAAGVQKLSLWRSYVQTFPKSAMVACGASGLVSRHWYGFERQPRMHLITTNNTRCTHLAIPHFTRQAVGYKRIITVSPRMAQP